MSKKIVITEEDVSRAERILQQYKSSKAAIEKRIVADEEWWKMRAGDEGESTGWLFNAIANKHADAMDNMPSPFVLPREPDDESSARELSEILPALLDSVSFNKVYSEIWYDKLRYGTGCYGVFWDPSLSGGKGDVDIKRIDILNLYWEGGISDLQTSKNVFYTQLWDNDLIREKYPHVKNLSVSPIFTGAKYLSEEAENTENKSVVVDWYYKRRYEGREVLHLCKFCSGQLLFATENDERYANGIYDHGKYPFFFDKLYTVQGSPCGFGLVDVMKNTQSQIDRLSASIVKNAEAASAVRYFIRTDGAVNEEEFADFTKPFVHVHGSRLGEDSIRSIVTPSLDANTYRILTHKIDELKETAGNRDFSQGGVSGGITAASAIAALQEAGNKLSRDMISASYGVFKDVVLTVIEIVRQFYTMPRVFRILGDDGSYSFVSYSSGGISGRSVDILGHTFDAVKPVFDVIVTAEKQSPFARANQNELAKEFFSMGLFDPSRKEEALLCISMMEFEGKDKLIRRLSQSKEAGSLNGAPRAAAPRGASPDELIADAVRRASAEGGAI
ncbi:MAG: hypothetical protein IKN38_06965 [Clostridia bacterium]|nr:hypothetical protein [Clostridia bacterium]